MHASYLEPMRRAYARTAAALFRPFDLRKWLAVGFTAFLAGLADTPHGSAAWRGRPGATPWRDVAAFPNRAWDWLVAHPFWFVAGALALAAALALWVALVWVSSRGKFAFLDDVVHDRDLVARPWREYRREGDSLFVWRILFGLLSFGLLFVPAGILIVAAGGLSATGFGRTVPPAAWLALGLALAVVVFAIAFVALLLDAFVAPLMYRDRLTAGQAWRRFLPLLGRELPRFVLFALTVLVLLAAFGIVVFAAGLATCCIGWALLVVPFVGTVVTLPFWYGLRVYSLEFLAQFGPEYAVLPARSTPEA